MYNNYPGGWSGYESGFGMMGPGFAHPWLLGIFAVLAPIIILVVLWSLVWKGLALWHAARRGQYWWFVILLVVNTVGILEIIYLFFVAKIKFSELFEVKEHHHHS